MSSRFAIFGLNPLPIAFIISFVLMFVFIGFLLIGVLCIYEIVVVIMASMKSNDGVRYRYPWAIRFIQ